MDEGAAEAEALTLAFGELADEPVGERAEVSEGDDVVDAGEAVGSAEAEGAGVEVEVLEHRHVFVGAEAVGDPAEEPADVGWVEDDIVTHDGSPASGGVVEGGEDAHGGGFASAVGADEADDAALVDGEGDPVDGAERAEVALEVFDEDGGSGHDRGESGDRAAEDDVIAFPADGGERVDETGAGV